MNKCQGGATGVKTVMQIGFRSMVAGGVMVGLGVMVANYPGFVVAQTQTPPTTSPTKGATFYDRYMIAGYEATNQRDYPTALIYFKRALDERPEDSYAMQAIRNVEGYLAKSSTPEASPQPSPSASATPAKPVVVPSATQATAKPTPTPSPTPTSKSTTPPKLTPPKPLPTVEKPTPVTKPPTAVVVVPAAPTSDAFNEQQAIALINRWLQAKPDVFAPPYDQQQVVDLTTGELLASLVRPNGVLDWLKANRAYFQYGVQKVDAVERFAVARDRATMEISLTEDRTLYMNGTIAPNLTDFSSQRVRFTFVLDNGIWKISDYKTVNGLLLERSILRPTSSVPR